jgi:hypothetical protein
MADAYESVRQGEARPFYGSVTASSGTVTTQGTPTATLYDGAGAAAAGFDGVDCTGWELGPAASVRAWLVVATAGLAPGIYALVFSIVVLGDDGIERTELPAVQITVATPTGSAGDYSAWPTPADVLQRLSNAGITLRGDADANYVQRALDDVTDEAGREAGRQFVADASDTTRLYDGRGLPEIEVDDLVSLTSVSLSGLGADGTTLPNATLVFEQGKPRNRLVLDAGALPSTSLAGGGFYPGGPLADGVGAGVWGALSALPRVFPAGRQNVSVTGRFGYAATVPVDLWRAVCGEAAARLAAEAVTSGQGRIVQIRDGGLQIHRQFGAPGDDAGWTKPYSAALKRYRKRARQRTWQLRRQMS